MPLLYPRRRTHSPAPSVAELPPASRRGVRRWVKASSSEGWRSRLLRGAIVTLGLTGGGVAVGTALWVGGVMVVRPQPPRWLTRYWPAVAANWNDTPPQTLAEIEAELAQENLKPGDFIDLANLSADTNLEGLWLVPVFATRSPCADPCEVIAALRLYGQYGPARETLHLQLLDHRPIAGPIESTVAEVAAAGVLSGVVGSRDRLPLTAVEVLGDERLPGLWLTLTGRWQRGGPAVLYGQVVYVDSKALRLRSLLNWSSPPNQRPRWYDLDRTGLPELVVNRSVGLDPRFNSYVVQSLGSSTRLQAIALTPQTLPDTAQQAPYDTALYLAQQGLWGQAKTRLEGVKTRLGDRWLPVLEQQLQLVTLHANTTQAQADRAWSQPGQQLLSLLIDGRWDAALTWLESGTGSAQSSVFHLLSQDSGRLWNRVSAMLRVDPNHEAARLWGALILMAQQDEAAATQWLAQANSAALQTRFKTVAARINPTNQPGSTSAIATASPSPPNTRWSATALVGTITPTEPPNPRDWQLAPGLSALPTEPRQWFVIRLQGGRLAEGWQPLPSATLGNGEPLWQALGLRDRRALQVYWQTPGIGPGTSVQVQAVQLQGGQITLLASGNPAPAAVGLAVTPGQLQALDGAIATALPQALATNATLRDRVLPALLTHVEQSGASIMVTAAGGELPDAIAAAEVRWWNFTGDDSPAVIITLPEATTKALDLPTSQTARLIFSQTGNLLHSDLSGPAWVATLSSDAGTSALVLRTGQTDILQFWAAERERFQ